MSARKYVPKASQRCGRCDRRGHNARSKLCPARLCDEAIARGFRAFAETLEGSADPGAGAGGVVEAAMGRVAAAARAAADQVSR